METRFDGLIIKFFFDIQYTDGIVRLILAILSLIRLTDFFILDDGPSNMFLNIRIFAANNRFLRKLFECPYCLSVWLAIPVGILYYVNVPISDIILIILGLAGAQSLLEDSRKSV